MADIFTSQTFNKIYVFFRIIGLFLKEFWSFLYIKIYILIILLLNVSGWLTAYFINSKSLPADVVSLHYNVDFGVNLIGPATGVYQIPEIASAISLINIAASLFYFKKNYFLSQLILAAATLSCAALLMAAILIYFINFR